jgi:hypothetical protein
MNLSAGNVNILDTILNLFRSLNGSRACWTRKNPDMNEISVTPLWWVKLQVNVIDADPLYKSGAIGRIAA